MRLFHSVRTKMSELSSGERMAHPSDKASSFLMLCESRS
jgi:hypothetical protein